MDRSRASSTTWSKPLSEDLSLTGTRVGNDDDGSLLGGPLVGGIGISLSGTCNSLSNCLCGMCNCLSNCLSAGMCNCLSGSGSVSVGGPGWCGPGSSSGYWTSGVSSEDEG